MDCLSQDNRHLHLVLSLPGKNFHREPTTNLYMVSPPSLRDVLFDPQHLFYRPDNSRSILLKILRGTMFLFKKCTNKPYPFCFSQRRFLQVFGIHNHGNTQLLQFSGITCDFAAHSVNQHQFGLSGLQLAHNLNFVHNPHQLHCHFILSSVSICDILSP